MNWKASVLLGRVEYKTVIPRSVASLSEMYLSAPFAPEIALTDMVNFESGYTHHNDEFIQQRCTDPFNTTANHRDGIVWATHAEIDIRDKLRDGKLIKLGNLNIQRQSSVPWLGLTWNVDEGGMIDEYLIISRKPLHDTNLPANSVPKNLPIRFGLRLGFDEIANMEDLILVERRRYQPDTRFVASQPVTASSTYGDLGSPAEDPQEASTRRYVSMTLADVETWGDSNAPINGPTIYVHRYCDMFIADRYEQVFGTVGEYPNNSAFDEVARNYLYNEMQINCTFPAVYVTLEGTAYEAELGELAVAYTKTLLQRSRLERDVERARRYSSSDDSSFDGGGGDHTADDHRENPDEIPED